MQHKQEIKVENHLETVENGPSFNAFHKFSTKRGGKSRKCKDENLFSWARKSRNSSKGQQNVSQVLIQKEGTRILYSNSVKNIQAKLEQLEKRIDALESQFSGRNCSIEGGGVEVRKREAQWDRLWNYSGIPNKEAEGR
jgi:hypothetical protein